MEHYKDTFDDFIIEGNEVWTQVCNSCSENLNISGKLLSDGVGNSICGVIGCQKVADLYYDIEMDENPDGYVVTMYCTMDGSLLTFDGFATKKDAHQFIRDSQTLDENSGSESWYLYKVEPAELSKVA